MKINTVFEDDYLKIVDKPAGLLTIPAPGKKRDLTSILNEEIKKRGVNFRLHPCHRLDSSTSGLVIYAKGKAIQKKIMQTFKEKKIKKTYIAFVQGRLFHKEGKISYPIEGRPAMTYYYLLEQRKDFAIVKVIPFTGRKNQIRIHFKKIGHPIVGEDRFAFRKDFKLRFKRLCLHAKDLEFMHPVTKKTISVETDLPLDLKSFLEKHPK